LGATRAVISHKIENTFVYFIVVGFILFLFRF
jgi:hypothetical protein